MLARLPGACLCAGGAEFAGAAATSAAEATTIAGRNLRITTTPYTLSARAA